MLARVAVPEFLKNLYLMRFAAVVEEQIMLNLTDALGEINKG